MGMPTNQLNAAKKGPAALAAGPPSCASFVCLGVGNAMGTRVGDRAKANPRSLDCVFVRWSRTKTSLGMTDVRSTSGSTSTSASKPTDRSVGSTMKKNAAVDLT